MTAVLRRFPGWAQIIPVFGVIILVVYTWSLMWFFWEIPSWMHFLHVGEIFILLAYTLATNFAESLAVLCGPLFVALILPGKWFRDVFVARGAALSIAGLGCMIFLAEQFTGKDAYPSFWLQVPTLLVAAAVIGGLVYLVGQITLLRKVFEVVADRVSVFTYIVVPLSLLSLVVVCIRLLIG
jgi:hypothetical protein